MKNALYFYPICRYVAARLPSGTSLIIEDVAPRQVYQIQLQPHPGFNMTSVYFKLQGNRLTQAGHPYNNYVST